MSESQFPVPRMQCRGCGKDAESHHPRYCHPVTDRLFLGLVIVGAVAVWIVIAGLWVR